MIVIGINDNLEGLLPTFLISDRELIFIISWYLSTAKSPVKEKNLSSWEKSNLLLSRYRFEYVILFIIYILSESLFNIVNAYKNFTLRELNVY